MLSSAFFWRNEARALSHYHASNLYHANFFANLANVLLSFSTSSRRETVQTVSAIQSQKLPRSDE